MRSIINISLPSTLKHEVETAVRRGGYATKSEFIRELLRLWKEDQLLKDLQFSQGEIKAGRGRVLKSLRSLR